MNHRISLHIKQFSKFSITGVIAVPIDLILIAVLVEMAHLPVLGSYILSSAFCLAFTFLLNRKWAFQHRGKITRKQITTFLAVYLTAIGFGLGIAYSLFLLGMWYLLSRQGPHGLLKETEKEISLSRARG
jgi:putative flippase GtrA